MKPKIRAIAFQKKKTWEKIRETLFTFRVHSTKRKHLTNLFWLKIQDCNFGLLGQCWDTF